MNPTGSVCWSFLRRYRMFMWAHHTSHALPCINTQQFAAKVNVKDKQALVISLTVAEPYALAVFE